MNQMRQVGLAILNHESTLQRFPPAAMSLSDDPDDDEENGHSMYSFLLPFMEERNVFDRIDFNLSWDDEFNEQLTKEVQLTLLECPSTPKIRRHKYTSGDVIDEDNNLNHVADYVPSWYLDARRTTSQMSAPSGRLKDEGILPIDTLWSLVPETIRTDRRGAPVRSRDQQQNQKWWGIMQLQIRDQQVKIRSAHVRDGLSNTFMLFESSGRPDHFAAGRQVPAGIMATANGFFRWGNPQLAIRIDETCGQVMNCHNWDEVYSFHRQTAGVVNADGSVHYYSEDMDPETFTSLYTMAGGDIADTADL